MDRHIKIVGICGSLRQGSHSRATLRSMIGLIPEGARYHEVEIGTLPHYNEDLDVEAAPTAVAIARALVASADAVIIVTPEFNHGIPGVLKNALDWLSRPAFSGCFVGKPVMFATISPGALGGVRAQYQLRETLSSMLCRLYPLPEIAVTHINRKLNGEQFSDEPTERHFRMVTDSFLGHAGLRIRSAA